MFAAVDFGGADDHVFQVLKSFAARHRHGTNSLFFHVLGSWEPVSAGLFELWSPATPSSSMTATTEIKQSRLFHVRSNIRASARKRRNLTTEFYTDGRGSGVVSIVAVSPFGRSNPSIRLAGGCDPAGASPCRFSGLALNQSIGGKTGAAFTITRGKARTQRSRDSGIEQTMAKQGQDRPAGLDGIGRALADAAKPGKLPPEQWNPPFCGDLDLRIASDGTWYYLGDPDRTAGVGEIVRLGAPARGRGLPPRHAGGKMPDKCR